MDFSHLIEIYSRRESRIRDVTMRSGRIGLAWWHHHGDQQSCCRGCGRSCQCGDAAGAVVSSEVHMVTVAQDGCQGVLQRYCTSLHRAVEMKYGTSA